ncbi:kinase-like domain-containing protein, partial [Amylostereum chailletii]
MQKFHVRDEVTGAERAYVAGVPTRFSPNVVSKGTHGYLAADLDDGSLVWIKDSWRLNKSYVRKEADVYRLLMEAEVPHVASMVCGGDVDAQETQSQNFVKAPWACETDEVRQSKIHHRVVLSTIGRPLKKFTSTRELTTATRDAIEAHSVVFTKLNILHGNISAGNILITQDGRGMLIDWDLAIDLAQESRSALAGTWQFISAALFDGKGTKPHSLQDDLESFVHVFVYHIVRYRPTSVEP